jgi:hypothetical protein
MHSTKADRYMQIYLSNIFVLLTWPMFSPWLACLLCHDYRRNIPDKSTIATHMTERADDGLVPMSQLTSTILVNHILENKPGHSKYPFL